MKYNLSGRGSPEKMIFKSSIKNSTFTFDITAQVNKAKLKV